MVISKKKIGLANKIFIGMIVGLCIGFIWPEFGISLRPIGMLFMKLLKMAVVPLIFANVVYGIGQMDDARNFGKAGSKLMIYYMLSTFVAALIGLRSAYCSNRGQALFSILLLQQPKYRPCRVSGRP